MKLIKFLRQNVLFANMDDLEINNVFDLIKGKIVKYPKGRVICRQGVSYEEIFVILEGDALTYMEKEDGEKEALSGLSVGDMINEVEGFIPNRTIDYCAVVLNEVTLLHIDIQSIFKVNSANDAVGAKFLNNIFAFYADKILNLSKNKDIMAIKSMRVKVTKLIYDKYLSQNNLCVDMGMNRNQMAEYLSVSRPSMSREMIRMREEGIINFRKEKIEILNLEKIREIIK